MYGYKIFGPNYTCRGYKYSLKNINNYKGKIEVGKSGFHYCPRPIDCLEYYDYSPENTYAKVECVGDEYILQDDKVVCKNLKIVTPLTYKQFRKLITYKLDTNFSKCTYVAGKLHGSYKEWYENGNLRIKCTYKNGLLNGRYNEWYNDGKVKIKTNYVNGNLHGSYKEWIGRFTKESYYVNGYSELFCGVEKVICVSCKLVAFLMVVVCMAFANSQIKLIF